MTLTVTDKPKRTRKPNSRWRSNLRHGLRSRHLPFDGGTSIAIYRNRYRVAIEDELLAAGREIGVSEATLVAAAVSSYEYYLKASFWLWKHYAELNHDQRLTFAREEMRGLAEAAKIIKQLGIDRNPAAGGDLWKAVQSANESHGQQRLEAKGIDAPADVPGSPQLDAESSVDPQNQSENQPEPGVL